MTSRATPPAQARCPLAAAEPAARRPPTACGLRPVAPACLHTAAPLGPRAELRPCWLGPKGRLCLLALARLFCQPALPGWVFGGEPQGHAATRLHGRTAARPHGRDESLHCRPSRKKNSCSVAPLHCCAAFGPPGGSKLRVLKGHFGATTCPTATTQLQLTKQSSAPVTPPGSTVAAPDTCCGCSLRHLLWLQRPTPIVVVGAAPPTRTRRASSVAARTVRATRRLPGCNPMCSGLQPYALRAAIPHSPLSNPDCAPGCGPVLCAQAVTRCVYVQARLTRGLRRRAGYSGPRHPSRSWCARSWQGSLWRRGRGAVVATARPARPMRAATASPHVAAARPAPPPR